MKLRYDPSVDAAYIDLSNDHNPPNFGYTYCCDPSEVNGQINLDFSADGRLLGIEILQASMKLPLELINNNNLPQHKNKCE